MSQFCNRYIDDCPGIRGEVKELRNQKGQLMEALRYVMRFAAPSADLSVAHNVLDHAEKMK